MKTNSTSLTLPASLLRVAGLVLTFLLIPFVLMRLTNAVDWSLLDFVVAGSLLFAASSVYVITTRNTTDKFGRLIIGLIIFAALLLVWAELAVGIFGTPWAGN